MHADANSIKFVRVRRQRRQQFGNALANSGCQSTGRDGQFQLTVTQVGDANLAGNQSRQVGANDTGQRGFHPVAAQPSGKMGLGFEHTGQQVEGFGGGHARFWLWRC